VERGAKVHDVSTTVLDDEQALDEPERRGRYGEQIHRGDVVLVISQEGDPSLDLVGLSGMLGQVS